MRRRFFWGTVLVATVTLLIGGVTASLLITRSVESSRRNEFFRQAEATGRLIQTALDATEDFTARRQLERLQEVLQVARLIGGHDYVEAVVRFPSERADVVIPTDSQIIAALPRDVAGLTERREFTDVAVGDDTVRALALPVSLGGSRRGLVVVGRTADLVPWGLVFGRFAFALLVAVALAALLAVGLSRSLGRRLDGLEEATGAIAAGDLSARADTGGGDEVARVAAAFNEMAERLEDAQRRERDFLMNVSHDLRTPLTTIRGYAEGLAEDAIDPADLPRVGGVLANQARRLSRLIEDLVLLSRLEARQFTLRSEPVDLAAHLKEVAEEMRGRADDARVRLTLDLADVGVVEVDPDRTAQVAGNLLENALRYTPEGGTVTLRLRRRPGGAVRFEVADTGPGIDPADIPHVFERLYVAQRYRPVRPEGSGLGLSIVKELVGAMGARVGVTSTPGEGTVLAVEFP